MNKITLQIAGTNYEAEIPENHAVVIWDIIKDGDLYFDSNSKRFFPIYPDLFGDSVGNFFLIIRPIVK